MISLDFGSVKLKATSTRVRKRDGTVFTEERTSGGGFESSAGTRAGDVDGASQGVKPQYVIDQENGVSRLRPKYFEPTANRWKPVPTDGMDGADGIDGAAEDTLQPLGELTCVTYNVWFDKRNQHVRALALFEILRTSEAHVISLQEVTPQFLGWLRDQEFVQEGYILSDSIGTTLKGSKLVYGVIQLVRRDRRIRVESMTLHAMPTNMNRSALVTSLTIAGTTHALNGHHDGPGRGLVGPADADAPSVTWRRVAVSTAHLESLTSTPYRKAQLEIIDRVTREAGAGLGPVLGGMHDGANPTSFDAGATGPDASDRLYDCLIMGDCNFDAGGSEENVLRQSEGEWEDLHHYNLYQGEEEDVVGPAEGITMPHDDVTGRGTRIDRVFAALNYLEPASMALLGTESIDIAAAAAETTSAATTQDHDINNTSTTVARCAAEADSDEDGGRRRVRFNIPADTIASVEERPSDHYGLMVRFVVRGSIGTSETMIPLHGASEATATDAHAEVDAAADGNPGGPADHDRSRAHHTHVLSSNTCKVSSNMSVSVDVSASGSSTSYFMITKPTVKEPTEPSIPAVAAAPAPPPAAAAAAAAAAVNPMAMYVADEDDEYGSEYGPWLDDDEEDEHFSSPLFCTNSTAPVVRRRMSPLWIADEALEDVDEELEARLEEAKGRAREMDRLHGPRRPAASYNKAGPTPLKDDPQYGKFFNMLGMGLPKHAVEMKMAAEGLDVAILELDPDKYRPPKQPRIPPPATPAPSTLPPPAAAPPPRPQSSIAAKKQAAGSSAGSGAAATVKMTNLTSGLGGLAVDENLAQLTVPLETAGAAGARPATSLNLEQRWVRHVRSKNVPPRR